MSTQGQDDHVSQGDVPLCTHSMEEACRACTPLLRDFVGDGMVHKIAYFREKVVLELATATAIPAALVDELCVGLLRQEMVEAWKNQEFVQNEDVCQSCGTLKPHSGMHCRKVRLRMIAMGIKATIAELRILPLIEAMQKSLPDELRRKLLKKKQ